MNKTALKNFAVRARNRLIADVTQKAYEAGVTKDKIHDILTFDGGFKIKGRENGKVFKKYEVKQRNELLQRIDEKGENGFEQMMEEIAYTWFNRFIALRFMEINNYLPTGVRVLSSLQPGKKEPDIIQEALNIDLKLNKDIVFRLQDNGDREDLYKYLLICQCNQLGEIMPAVFEKIEDYTELLLPDNLLAEGSVIMDLVESIEEYDWKIELDGEEKKLEEEKGEHGIEIIGWLYQYYISEKKDEVFAGLKKNIKITKENIPAATQLFTPAWIVKYMVENSLGRLWLESKTVGSGQETVDSGQLLVDSEKLKRKWKYYLDEAEQEPGVQKQLEQLRDPDLSPEEIKILDPAMGSGHILVYAFDVLYDIYLSAGYSERQIPGLILEKNLYGLDIDDRAGQLAYFALLMKARSKNRRIFSQNIELNLCSIQESNLKTVDSGQFSVGGDGTVDREKFTVDVKGLVKYFVQGVAEEEKIKLKEDLEYLLDVFYDAKEYGSILEVRVIDFAAIEKRLKELKDNVPEDVFELKYREVILKKMQPLDKQGKIMSRKYHVVCTNPPYMGRRNMNPGLVEFLNDEFPDSKADLFAVFMEIGEGYLRDNGFMGMINQQSWMFLSSYEKLREKIVNYGTIYNMIHLGPHAFEEIGGAVVQSTAFVLQRSKIDNYKGSYIRLGDWQNAKEKEAKALEAVADPNVGYRYTTCSSDFSKIPGSPIAYWVSEKIVSIYIKGKSLGKYATPKTGMTTANNNKFLRLWFEVSIKKINNKCRSRDEAKNSGAKWFPYSKGGGFRRWEGYDEYVINWENNGMEIKNYKDKAGKKLASVRSEDKYFKPCITWSAVTSYKFSSRIVGHGRIFDSGGSSIFLDQNVYYVQALLNTRVAQLFLSTTNTTLNYQPRDISNIPIILSKLNIERKVGILVNQSRKLSKTDWDSFETSWDFKSHPLLLAVRGQLNNYPLSTTNYQLPTDNSLLSTAFKIWSDYAESQFNQLKANEEELNRIFIDIYGLQDELTPEVEDKDVTISKADRERDIKSFISYAVGCMLGRYSLDKEGLIYAGNTVSSGQLAVDRAVNSRRTTIEWIVEKIITGMEGNEDSKLPAVDSLEKVHGSGREDLSGDKEVPQGRNVSADNPITEGGSFHTVEYSRRTSQEIDSRISEILNDCPRFKSGSGDANNDCPAFKLCESRRIGRDFKANKRDYKNNLWTDEQSKITAYCPLSTICFLPKADNIIPIADGDYFEDDILERFIGFVKVIFGKETLEENLNYIAETLGVRAGETSRQAIRRYFLSGFYKDHVQIYKKRPIYWLFDSSKENGFKALIYMHRYDPHTVARVRTDYLHELQRKYEAEIKLLDILIDSNISTREKAVARKKKETINKQIQECRLYDQAIGHVAGQRIEIDLDDGVKVNYAKFQGVEIPRGEGGKPQKTDLLAKI